MKRVRVTADAVKKTISITCSKFVSVASVIQHSMRMRRVILLSVAHLALLIFFHIIS